MTSNPAWALQKALYATLATTPALTALIGSGGIHDDVPADAAFPYVTIGETLTRDWSTQTRRGHEHQVTIHAWSRAAGRKETQEIVAAMDAALDGAALALDGHRLINLRTIFWHALAEADGLTYHGILRLRAVTEPV